MKYKIYFTEQFEKELSKLDKYTQKMIMNWIKKNIMDTVDPRIHGKALVGNLKGHWRYRIGDYRLICVIEDDRLIIYFLNVGHRREIYQRSK